jgi:hypothetical protein
MWFKINPITPLAITPLLELPLYWNYPSIGITYWNPLELPLQNYPSIGITPPLELPFNWNYLSRNWNYPSIGITPPLQPLIVETP